MEEYKGYYIEEQTSAPDTRLYECIVYENEYKMTQGDYIQTFDSVDSAKNWIDAREQELINILAPAQRESDTLRGQFSQGILTPLDYAKYQESLWIRTRIDIESRG